MKSRMGQAVSAASILLASLAAQAATYKCEMKGQAYLGKDGSMATVSPEELKKRQASLVIEDEKAPFVERCSFSPSDKKVACDRYPIDRVEVDRNVDIKKFYLFRSQFDVQLFSNLSVVENNGRSGVAYGTCKLVKP